MFGYEPAELVGSSWSRLYRNEADASYVEREVMAGLSADSPWSGKTLHERRDRSLFCADYHLDVVDGGFTVCRVKNDVEVRQVSEQAPPVVSD